MLIKRICISCGIEFQGGPRAWRCPDCRIERNRETNTQHKARKRSGKSRLLGSTDRCTICGKPYTVEGGAQRYCKECAPEQHREVDRVQSLDWYRREKESINPRRNARRRIPFKVCPICGKKFETHNRTVCCSLECRRKYVNQNWNEIYGKRYREKKAASKNRED